MGVVSHVPHDVTLKTKILRFCFALFRGAYLAAGVVGVLGQFAVESLEENLIRDFANIHAGFIQHREDALMLLLHQIHNDLVIEVIDLTTKHTEERGINKL